MGDEKRETISASSFLEKFSIEGVNRNEVVAKETSGVVRALLKANIRTYLYGNGKDPTKMSSMMEANEDNFMGEVMEEI